MRQVTRSKRASSKGSASASARAVSMLAKPLASASLAASTQHLLGEVAGDRRGRRAGRTPPPCARRRWRYRAPARTAAAAPARPAGRGSRPWRARSRWHRPPHARRTAAARGIWSSDAPSATAGPWRTLACRAALAQPRQVQPSVCPPSTDSVCPVTQDAASLHRNRAALATSSGAPSRPHGIERRIAP